MFVEWITAVSSLFLLFGVGFAFLIGSSSYQGTCMSLWFVEISHLTELEILTFLQQTFIEWYYVLGSYIHI